MDRSQHIVTKYLSDKKAHAAINSKVFKELDHVDNATCEVELGKAQIEHKKPIIVGIISYNTPNYECWCSTIIFPTNLGDVHKFELLGMDTTSLYLALAEKELDDCTRPEMKAEWEQLR